MMFFFISSVSIGGVCSLFFGLSILSAIRDIVRLARYLYGLRSKLVIAVSANRPHIDAEIHIM